MQDITETEKEVMEKTYRFLFTTATRDGIKRIFIGLVKLEDKEMQVIHVGKMKENEDMKKAAKRIGEKIWLSNIKIKRYLGKFDLGMAEGTARVFNFEIS